MAEDSIEMSTPISEGRAAYKAGKAITDNPYVDDGTRDYGSNFHRWEAGWAAEYSASKTTNAVGVAPVKNDPDDVSAMLRAVAAAADKHDIKYRNVSVIAGKPCYDPRRHGVMVKAMADLLYFGGAKGYNSREYFLAKSNFLAAMAALEGDSYDDMEACLGYMDAAMGRV